MPSLSTILWARSGWDVPLNTFIFGILLCKDVAGFSKFARTKLFARIGPDQAGITEITPQRKILIERSDDLRCKHENK